MSKYLFYGSYTEEGLKGLLKEGGSKRREATEHVIKSVGGTLQAYYFAFGDKDFYLIADVPDKASASACSLVATATGTCTVKTVVLLTPEEIDQAVKKTVEYRPPGQ